MTTELSNHLWFLNTFVTVRVSYREGHDRISVLEHWAPVGDSPPLHIHRTEDEIFQILEGEFRFQVEGRLIRSGPGDIILTHKGVPHTYRVDSPAGGRFLTTTVRGDFEKFVRAFSRPADRLEPPPRGGPPSPEAVQALTAGAAGFGIELIGPPLA
jgi:quercetin dioxygenase-like cupin family protein